MSIDFRVNGDKSILHDKINASLGITDKKIHTVFYMEGSTFITPNVDFDNFNDVMTDIKVSCKNLLKNKLRTSDNIDRNFLMNFEVSSDRMKKDKKTFLSFQYHFKQKNNANKNIFAIKNENYDFFISLLSDVENEIISRNMTINKNKKD